MTPYLTKPAGGGKPALDPNARRVSDGSTVLQLAIKSKSPDMVQLVLESGGNVSLTDFVRHFVVI